MKSESEIKKKLEELEKLKFNWYPYDEDFKIKNIDEYNTAIKVLKWILEK
ncbi:MAG: hypothetical protein RQ930_03735 [Candidatus Aenigmarchaeota archaeon]|nr:hypothetical protein [Candidatus Aenigmarchaeota archaeon]